MRAMPCLAAVLRDDRGVNVVEFALVLSLLLIVTMGIVEIGIMLFAWNAAEKATHLGVRKAVVSDVVATDLSTFDGTGSVSLSGASCMDSTTGVYNDDCVPDPNPVVCDSAGCNGYGYSATAFAAIVTEIQRVFPRVEPENVVVEYRFVGLGFIGRPGGFPYAVTVRLQNLTYDFLVLDALVGMPDQLTMPSFAATMSGEDLSNTVL